MITWNKRPDSIRQTIIASHKNLHGLVWPFIDPFTDTPTYHWSVFDSDNAWYLGSGLSTSMADAKAKVEDWFPKS